MSLGENWQTKTTSSIVANTVGISAQNSTTQPFDFSLGTELSAGDSSWRFMFGSDSDWRSLP